MWDELPFLERLQRNRSDLYDASWTCPSCSLSAKENWNHLCSCPAYTKDFQGLNIATHSNIIEAIKCHAPKAHLTPTWKRDLAALSCWELPSTSPTPNFSFDLLLRGFIPLNLVNHIKTLRIASTTVTAIIAESVTATQLIFRKTIWHTRCEQMVAFEKNMGIDACTKKSKRIYLSNRSHTQQSSGTRTASPSLSR